MIRYRYIAFLLLAICADASTDHKAGAPWSWHVLSAGLDESRVAIYRQQQLIGIFDFSCDLTTADAGAVPGNDASLNLVQSQTNPEGLLIVTCNVGAHSQYIAIIDPTSKLNRPVFSRTGSYFVKWELEDGELWISFDQPCDEGPSVECPDGFESIFVQYPDRQQPVGDN